MLVASWIAADIEAFETASDLLQFYGSAAAIEVDDSLTLEIGANSSARSVSNEGACNLACL